MRHAVTRLLLASVVGGMTVIGTHAHGRYYFWDERPTQARSGRGDKSFQRVGTLANYRNNANRDDQTVSEIITATADGRTLVYSDSVLGSIGFINIANPAHPFPTGVVALDSDPTDDVEYSPTSVEVLGNRYALVAADTSASFTDASGSLVVIDITTRTVVAEIDLGGQPDSIKISPDERYAAIAIENQRNEFLCVGGTQGGIEAVEDEDDHVPGHNTTEDLCEDGGGQVGILPQTSYGNPAGFLAVIKLHGPPASWSASAIALTGYSAYAPGDPEPEFVDINGRNEAVVTLQENNHIVIVDLKSQTVIDDFSAGAVTLNGIDATEDGVISLTESLNDVPREPDAVVWVPGAGGHQIATANEGDLFGGSRGFTLFRRSGSVAFDSGASFEEVAVRHGHYPESRSENKGTEPEAIAYAHYAGDGYLFVGSERGSFVAVYQLDRFGRPAFAQLLPAPLAPEGLLTIPGRNLLVTSGEEDSPEFGVRSTVMIYQLKPGQPAYPQVVSDDENGSPIPWSALSGLTSIPGAANSILAVWDSYYSASKIFRIDVSEKPAVLTNVMTIQGGEHNGTYDPEGIAIAPDDTLWIASEGNASDSVPNLLMQLDKDGNVLREVGLPPQIIACRAATRANTPSNAPERATLGSGFEGVAVLKTGGGYRLLVAQQRGWDYRESAANPDDDGCEELDDDGGGLNDLQQPNWTRIWVFDPDTGAWRHVSWQLVSKPANAAWVGLSEITAVGDGEYIVIERDNLTGDFSKVKTLAQFDWHTTRDGIVRRSERSVYDLLPSLRTTDGWITDKPEGVAVTDDGRTFVVTDNDGVEDWSGETWFLSLGRYWRLF
jgi:hypothetical protein